MPIKGMTDLLKAHAKFKKVERNMQVSRDLATGKFKKDYPSEEEDPDGGHKLPAGEMDDGKEESDSDIMSVSDNEHSSEDGDQIDANGYIQKTKEGKKRAAVIKAVKEDEKWKADGIRRNARMQAIIERELMDHTDEWTGRGSIVDFEKDQKARFEVEEDGEEDEDDAEEGDGDFKEFDGEGSGIRDDSGDDEHAEDEEVFEDLEQDSGIEEGLGNDDDISENDRNEGKISEQLSTEDDEEQQSNNTITKGKKFGKKMSLQEKNKDMQNKRKKLLNNIEADGQKFKKQKF